MEPCWRHSVKDTEFSANVPGHTVDREEKLVIGFLCERRQLLLALVEKGVKLGETEVEVWRQRCSDFSSGFRGLQKWSTSAFNRERKKKRTKNLRQGIKKTTNIWPLGEMCRNELVEISLLWGLFREVGAPQDCLSNQGQSSQGLRAWIHYPTTTTKQVLQKSFVL